MPSVSVWFFTLYPASPIKPPTVIALYGNATKPKFCIGLIIGGPEIKINR